MNYLKFYFVMFLAVLGISKASADDTPAYDNVAATFTWTVGNEKAAALSDGIADAVNTTTVKAGSDLTVTTRTDLAANNKAEIVDFAPATAKQGVTEAGMVEYSVKMKNGITFTLTGISFDAIKNGTDGLSLKWSYTVDGVESTIFDLTQDEILRNNNSNASSASLNHKFENLTVDAGQKVTFRVYSSGVGAGKSYSLGNVVLTGTVTGTEIPRSFVDFKVDCRIKTSDEQPYTVFLPTTGTLPDGVTFTASKWNGAQHGLAKDGTMVVPVDGAVKFTIGGCKYGGDVTVKDAEGNLLAIIDAKSGGCESTPSSLETATYTSNVTWTYNSEEANTLTFDFSNTYLPYFFAEKCDFIPSVTVTYYDVDGKTVLGSYEKDGGSELAYEEGLEEKVTVAEGKKFRGWFTGTGETATKISEGKSLDDDLNLYAKATDIEVVEVGKRFVYDLTENYFYFDDHEAISISDGAFYHGSQHGWAMNGGGTIELAVAGKAYIVVKNCKYSATQTATIEGCTGEASIENNVSADGASTTYIYDGEATTLKLVYPATAYVHEITVYNVSDFIDYNEETGYYEVPAGDASSLLLALASANNDGRKVFLPNGTYDLGETALTSVGDNVSIIGESMEGTIIKNRPLTEGIGVTATLLLTGKNIYMQDLTLDCIAPYGSANESAERGVCLQDKGSNNICKNVYLKGLQDTYYSNGAEGMKGYFETSKIEGTVDFICGAGTVFFNNCGLMVADRSTSATSANVICAPNTYASETGYVFNNCTVDATTNQNGKYSFGRPWSNSSAATFLNTTLKVAGSAAGYANMSTVNQVRFHEYNTTFNGEEVKTHNTDACKVVTGGTKDELYITAAAAAEYALDKVFTDWTPATDCEQVEITATDDLATKAATYLVYIDGELNVVSAEKVATVLSENATAKTITLRAANARGGFGAEYVYKKDETAVSSVEAQEKAAAVTKFVSNNQVVIVKNGEKYNVAGQRID